MKIDNQVRSLKKDLLLIFIMGSLYMLLEGLWRGWTNIFMLIVGGLSCFLIGRLNEKPAFYNKKLWEQCLLGTGIILLIEFTSGMILNVYFKLGLWDYSKNWGNLYGQICLAYALLWFFLVPLAINIDDYLRYKLFGEEKPPGWLQNYQDLFLGR